jgi:pimeloyl-ACP methyl ester carboxylesterase
MHEITHEQVDVGEIELHVASCGPADGYPVLLCHGFPELWYSWRHQLAGLGAAGFRALAPDLRGYGDSGCPAGDVAHYGSDRITNDLCGLLDHYGYDQGVFVGHDWGALVVWEMGKLHPGRVAAIYNMSVPFSPPPASPPIERLEAIFADKFFYILYFQPVGPAEAELESDPRTFLRRFFYSAGGEGRREGPGMGLAPRAGTRLQDTLLEAPARLPAWLGEDDVDVYAAAFTKSGFFGPLSYYRNLDANWRRSRDVPSSVLCMPTGFLTGSLDPVKGMFRNAEEAMASELPEFRGTTEVEGAGHWVQQERPSEVNAALLGFLSSLD